MLGSEAMGTDVGERGSLRTESELTFERMYRLLQSAVQILLILILLEGQCGSTSLCHFHLTTDGTDHRELPVDLHSLIEAPGYALLAEGQQEGIEVPMLSMEISVFVLL